MAKHNNTSLSVAPIQNVLTHTPEIKISDVCKRIDCTAEQLTIASNELGVAIKNQKILETDIQILKNYFNTFSSISKIEINGLWGTHNFIWDLNKSANILIGTNGSGKSTIINLVNAIINEGPSQKDDLAKYAYHFDEVIITFNNTRKLLFKKLADSRRTLNEKYKSSGDVDLSRTIAKEAQSYLKSQYKNLSNHVRVEITPKGAGYYASDYDLEKTFGTLIKVKRISTFDNFIKDARTTNLISNIENVETDLDWELRQLMGSIKSYQLTIKQRETEMILPLDAKIAEISQKTAADIDELKGLQEILREKENIKRELHKIEDRLFEVVNELFSNLEMPELSKKIGTDGDNDFIFEKDNKQVIQLFQLSSGEKQLLIILMNAVLLDEKRCVLLLDEPEISLHILWQEVFLDKIRYLAPNTQIVMVTHGSDMVIKDEWYYKTTNIQKLIHKI